MTTHLQSNGMTQLNDFFIEKVMALCISFVSKK